ncbi:MAG: FAD-dependent oxidoreductase, partial [uncultured Nocardioides sp.]
DVSRSRRPVAELVRPGGVDAPAGADPRHHRRGRRRRTAGTRERDHGQDDRHRSQLHPDRGPGAHVAAARRAHRDRRGGPVGDDRHRPRRHPSPRPQPRARAARPVPAQHGRHRRADPGGRGLHRHPRDRRRRGRALGPARRHGAGDRHRRGRPRVRDGERRRPRRRPGGTRRAGRPHHADVPCGAALRARGPRGADDLGPRAGDVRRDGRDRAPRRHVLVPPHRPRAGEAEPPHGPRPRRAAAPGSAGRVVGGRAALQPRVRRGRRSRQPPAGGGPRDQPRGGAGPVGAEVHRPRPPGVREPAAGGVPGDGVRRAARCGTGRAAGVPSDHRRQRLADRLPRRGPARAGGRRAAVDRPRPRHPLPRVPHRPRRRPHGVLRGAGAGPARGRGSSPLGQAAQPDGRGPRAVVRALRRRPRDARPARPRPGPHQRPPAPGAGRL